ncbi:MAG: ROK family protein [Rubrobacter sp.]|nr:ROK family protein [Rubrobacteraceae bacterium]MBA3794892.1 ROK family protein [Rubrobacter sp.]MDQ3316476.1 ROK family protein [Actinomycetota bacterium]MDQ3429755.1 ROK family protein [Actinomycetota bacterium]
MNVFGLDVGGSGIKGAPVDTETGMLLAERVRIKTPHPATPAAIVRTAVKVVRGAGWDGPVGCGFPAVVKDGVVHTAANIDDAAIGFDLGGALEERLGRPVGVVNDADAAGLAEVRWGEGRNRDGVVLMLTLGTGIGTSLFVGGRLVPNTELGHIEIGGRDAEHRASDTARKREDLSWKQYAHRLDEYLRKIEDLLWPDVIVVGGGISKKADKFLPHLTTRTEIVIAKMLNEAGIAGAALAGIPDRATEKVAE